jgi:hypothetical protein
MPIEFHRPTTTTHHDHEECVAALNRHREAIEQAREIVARLGLKGPGTMAAALVDIDETVRSQVSVESDAT